MSDDIATDCVAYLLEFDDVRAAVGVFPDTGTPWLFPHSLWQVVENTQSVAVVVTVNGGWASPNEHNTLRFPRLGIDIWADPLRNPDRSVRDPGELHQRINRVYKVFDTVLHRPRGGHQYWNGTRVIDCVRMTEPMLYVVPDGTGLIRCQTYYAATVG